MAWKVMLKAGQPAREWKVYVRASDGKILEKINLIKVCRRARPCLQS